MFRCGVEGLRCFRAFFFHTLFASVALLFASAAASQQSSHWIPKQAVSSERAMVVAAHPLAVDAGMEMLRRGGSAVDAAIAAQMVLSLVEPQSSGIGGGGFLLHYHARSRKLKAYDGRETTPASVTPHLFLNAQGRPLAFNDAAVGGRSVGVPGVPRMLEQVHRQYGKLPWRALFEPAIRIAETGFPISPRLYRALAMDTLLRTQQPAADYFYRPDGTPRPTGSILRNPALAKVFRSIAAKGAKAFYGGQVARDIVVKVRAHPINPGVMTEADLASYRAIERDPVCTSYRQFRVCGMPPPSSGGITVAQILGILENFDMASLMPNTVEAIHLISEAYRLAYADRGVYIADSDFVAVPVAGLLDKAYLADRAALIDLNRSMGVPASGTPPGAARNAGRDTALELPSTSHISIVDRQGNAVSMTTSIEAVWGSRQMVRGFMLNNQLTDFSFISTDAQGQPIANRIEPGKRPRSSMAPTIVFNEHGSVEMVVGSPGGSAIIQYVAKVLLAVLDWRLSIQEAIDLGNFGAQASAVTQLERGTSIQDLRDALEALGHNVSIVDMESGLYGIHANGDCETARGSSPAKPCGAWAGGADPRREGVAKGL